MFHQPEGVRPAGRASHPPRALPSRTGAYLLPTVWAGSSMHTQMQTIAGDLMNRYTQNQTSTTPLLGCNSPFKPLTTSCVVSSTHTGRESHRVIRPSMACCMEIVRRGHTLAPHPLNIIASLFSNNHRFSLKKETRESRIPTPNGDTMNDTHDQTEQTDTKVSDQGLQREAYKIWFANNITANRGMSFATALELAAQGMRA